MVRERRKTMAKNPVPSAAVLLSGQCALTLTAMLMAALLPRTNAPVLLLPITRHAARDIPARLFDGTSRILGAGPVRGSFVVLLANDQAWGTLVASGVLPLAYDVGLCGARRDG
jgi:hypothetical protein